MKQIFIKAFSLCMLALSPGLVAPANAAPADQVELTRINITIITATGRWPFAVELARRENERARGLMFRKSLAANGGMLFIFDREERVAMWMKNTYIPLDMLFIDAKGRIINIAKNTKVQSLDVIASAKPALAVLEVAGGTADRLGIRPGDRLLSDFFIDN